MRTEEIDFQHRGKTYSLFAAYPNPSQTSYPVILIFHTWQGRSTWMCEQAKKVAEMGYLGIAVDMYGKGVIGKNKEENSALMMPFIQDRGLLRELAQATFTVASNIKEADKDKIGAIGFCFGGLCALDLARSGVNLKGVVSFHGLLNSPQGLAKEKIQSKILVLNGYDDPLVDQETLQAFAHEMNDAHVDWQLHHFSHTMHGFTNPEANDPAFGAVYNPLSAKRSWQLMREFFKEIF